MGPYELQKYWNQNIWQAGQQIKNFVSLIIFGPFQTVKKLLNVSSIEVNKFF